MATKKKPKPIKPVSKSARNIKNRKPVPKADPPPPPTDKLFRGLIEAGNQAMAEQRWEAAEDLFLHARFVGSALNKTEEEKREAARGHRRAFFKLLEAGDK